MRIAARMGFLAGVGVLLAATGTGAWGQQELTLFNGSMLGWTQHGGWTAGGGALTGNGNGSRSVVTAVAFGELNLTFEYQESAAVGAKVRLWTTAEDTGGVVIDLDATGTQGVGGIESLSHSSIGSVSTNAWHRAEVQAMGGRVFVRIDGQPAGVAGGLGSRGGHVAFEANTSGMLQVRNVKLTPGGLNSLFNGTDLSGWKSVAKAPEAKGGVGHTVEKTFSFGMAGGATKPHEARWSVKAGMIHGENGPGSLENSQQVQDGVIAIAAEVKNPKGDDGAALSLRNAPGQWNGGYAVGIGPFAGTIANVAKHGRVGAGMVNETIVIAGRTIAVWANGQLLTVHTDTRAENGNTDKGAKTGAGAVALMLADGGEQVDVKSVGMAVLPKTYGMAAKAPPPPPPVVTPAVTTPAVAAAPPSAAETALLAQQQQTAKQQQADQQKQQRVAGLMSQALATTDPQQQMSAYGQVVQLDPSNAAAVQGYKDAQGKIAAQQAAQQNQAAAQANEAKDAVSREAQTNESLAKAQGAFLGGHLGDASQALSVAERLSPGNPLVRDLRQRIGSAQSLRSRLFMLGGGAGLLGLAGLIALWLRRRKQQRFPALEMTRGLENGRVYSLDKDVVRIGAVAQDGGQRNDIVVQDVEHAVSRFHCEVLKKNGLLYVNDLKSSNGTTVDGESVQPGRPVLLKKGSRIGLANSVELEFGYGRKEKV